MITPSTPQISAPSAPPVSHIGPWAWAKKNLFSSWSNTILTIISILFVYWLLSTLIVWAFTQAQWQVLRDNFRLFFVGRYPIQMLWRPWATLGVIMGLGGLSWGIWTRNARLLSRGILIFIGLVAAAIVALAFLAGTTSSAILLGLLVLVVAAGFVGQVVGRRVPALGSWLPLIWLLAFFVCLWLLEGGLLGLRKVRLDDFSGLLLTLLSAVVSIVLSFPFGVLLALGRRSNLPVVRWFSITYIEVIRGLPLITILFASQVMLALVLPPGVRPDRVIRAIAGLTLFSAAYLAENVRGGLQSVPRGQTEAANALGLNPLLVTLLITLPQALKAVIPTIVGQFISLFKDTSLLSIVGLAELLGIAQAILANPEYQGRYAEVYLFVGLIYWVCCYAMSWASRRIERQLGVGHQ